MFDARAEVTEYVLKNNLILNGLPGPDVMV